MRQRVQLTKESFIFNLKDLGAEKIIDNHWRVRGEGFDYLFAINNNPLSLSVSMKINVSEEKRYSDVFRDVLLDKIIDLRQLLSISFWTKDLYALSETI